MIKKERSDLQKIEFGNIMMFPIGNYNIEGCVIIDDIEKEAAVYVTNPKKPICKSLLKLSLIDELKSKNDVEDRYDTIYMSFGSFFAIKMPEEMLENQKYKKLQEEYELATIYKDCFYTVGNKITCNGENYLVERVNVEGQDSIVKINISSGMDLLKKYYLESYEDTIGFIEDMTFILKLDKEKWEKFDESLIEQIMKDHVMKENDDNEMEMYYKNFMLTID